MRLTAGGNTLHPATEDFEWPKRTYIESLYKKDLDDLRISALIYQKLANKVGGTTITNFALMAHSGQIYQHNVPVNQPVTSFTKSIEGIPRTIHIWEAKTERGKLLQGL